MKIIIPPAIVDWQVKKSRKQNGEHSLIGVYMCMCVHMHKSVYIYLFSSLCSNSAYKTQHWRENFVLFT